MSFVVSIFFPAQFSLFMCHQKTTAICHWSVRPHRWSHLLNILCHQQRYTVIGNTVCESFTELIQSACRGLGISISSSSAAGSFGGQEAVCASIHEGCLTLALSLGFSLACCLQTSGPDACVHHSGWILHTFPFWLLRSPSLESFYTTALDLALRPRDFHGAGEAFLF